jgi:uncharacterized membrane protein YdjX (TVP38/TMEM64 family)
LVFPLVVQPVHFFDPWKFKITQNDGYATDDAPDMKTRNRIVVALLLIAGLAGAARFFPIAAWISFVIEWVRGAGNIGLLVYFLFYTIGVVLFLPGSLLTLGAGFLYGPLLGTLLVSPASVAGATLAFLAGRFVARDWVMHRIASSPKFSAIDEGIGKRGFYIVFLIRLSPVFPFTLLNYALGLTRVKLRDYVLASFLGMLPGTFLYVYFGSLITSVAQLLSGKRPVAGPWGEVLFFGGLAATVAVTWLITRVARRALDRALQSQRVTTPETEVAGR